MYFKKAVEEYGPVPAEIEPFLMKEARRRTPSQREAVRDYFRSTYSDGWRVLSEERAQVAAERDAFMKTIPTSMVMKEQEEPRTTHLLKRGQYDQPLDPVQPDTPDALPPMPDDAPKNRLGLATWVASRENPLTARVAVNRLWVRFFGTGLVKTTEDFGMQGEWPSHPNLLDWLAVEFMETGWDLKAFQRMIVTSSTYRQSARSNPRLNERDPQNRLLARMSRFRMDAEMIRDNALAVSGLLVRDIGGPSVSPYQPLGLWREVGYGGNFSAQTFVLGEGDELYRRSLYTFWKRTAPPPNMMAFDAPNRETCTVMRSRSNTPLQALTLMNDPQYVEAARGLAERIMRESDATPEARIRRGYRLATAREPSDEEVAVLMNFVEAQAETIQDDQETTAELLTVGASAPSDEFDSRSLTLWTTVANLLLNLDETVTKS